MRTLIAALILGSIATSAPALAAHRDDRGEGARAGHYRARAEARPEVERFRAEAPRSAERPHYAERPRHTERPQYRARLYARPVVVYQRERPSYRSAYVRTVARTQYARTVVYPPTIVIRSYRSTPVRVVRVSRTYGRPAYRAVRYVPATNYQSYQPQYTYPAQYSYSAQNGYASYPTYSQNGYGAYSAQYTYPSQYGYGTYPQQYGYATYPSQYGYPSYPSQYAYPSFPSQYANYPNQYGSSVPFRLGSYLGGANPLGNSELQGVVVANSGDSLVVLTPDMRPVFVNIAPAQQLGYTNGALRTGSIVQAYGYSSGSQFIATAIN